MFVHEQIHCLIEPVNTINGRTLHALSFVVDDLSVWYVMNRITSLNGAIAIIEVFTKHKKPLI